MDASGLPAGTVYPALRRLEAGGYLRSEWETEDMAAEGKRPQRRYYELTADGVVLLQSARERFRGLTLEAQTTPSPDPEMA
jgi:DNA-binding PadR family transcriptional regulator